MQPEECQGNENAIAVKVSGRCIKLDVCSIVTNWFMMHPRALSLLSSLASDPGMRRHLTSLGAIRSLALLIYARSNGLPPYRAKDVLGVSGEQLYRIERAIRREGLYRLYFSSIEAIRVEDRLIGPRAS